MRRSRKLLLLSALLGSLPLPLYAEGTEQAWQSQQPLPVEVPVPQEMAPPLGLYERAQLAESRREIVTARDLYAEALRENPNQPGLREHYAWFLYSYGYQDRQCLRLLEESQPTSADPGAFLNAIIEVRERLGLPPLPKKKSAEQQAPAKPSHPKAFRKDFSPYAAVTAPAALPPAKRVIKEEIESVEPFRHWILIPTYSYSFFNKGRQGWQEEDVQLYYRVNPELTLGGEIDILQRPPSGTDIYYSALASYYLRKWLEVHGKISICPDPTFAATQIYSGGVIYQALPRLGVLLDYQHYNFIQGPIDQINPGLAYNFTDDTSLTLRYVRGWAFYNLEYNYYAAAFNLGLPGNRRLSLGFAYGTDPDAEVGANGNNVTSLSPAYTYSVFFTQPITRDLNLIAGIQYIYRLRESGGELYQQLTPTAGISWKF